MRKVSWLTWVRRFLAPVASIAMVVLVVRQWSVVVNSEELTGQIPLAVLLGLAGLILAGVSWARISRSAVWPGVASFGLTLPLRHLPMGGLAQMLGLAGLSTMSSPANAGQSTTADLFGFMAATGTAAAVVAAPLVLVPATPTWLIAVVTASLFTGGVIVAVSQRGLTLSIRSKNYTPSPLAAPTSISVASVLGSFLAFAVLFDAGPSFGYRVVAMAAAWLCGFLFIVAPGGLGMREAVLVLLFPAASSAVVVAASLLLRLTTMIAELILFALSWRMSRAWDRAGHAEAETDAT